MRRVLLVGIVLAVAGVAGAFPDEERAILEVGSTVVDLVVSPDDRLVGIASGDGALRVIDTADVGAGVLELPACGAAASVAYGTVEGMTRFYVACGDGTVAEIELDTAVIPAEVTQSFTVEIGTGSLAGAAVDDTMGRMLAVEEGDGEVLYHVFELDTGDLDALTGLPISSPYDVVALAGTPQGTYLVAANDQGRVTKLYRSGDAYTIASFQLLGLSNIVDVATMDESYAYLLDSSGTLAQYWLTADNDFSTIAYDLGSVERLAPVWTADSSYLYVVDSSGTVQVVPPVVGAGVEATLTLGRDAEGGLAASSADDARVYAGVSEGGVSVISEAPWVEITAVEPAEIHEGESTELSFTVDEDCSYDLFLGGDIDQSGTVLSGYSGTASAGETVTLAVDGGDLGEGENRLFVFATAGGFTGRDSATVALDTPPDVVADFELGFGDEKLTVRWIATDETDIDHYNVYFADGEFDEAGGAPEFRVEGPGVVIESPARAGAGEPGEAISYTLEYLTNGVEYCVAVSGVDTGGQEGPWTETLCQRPELTIGAGDGLGYCGTCRLGAAAAAPWTLGLLGTLVALAAVRRR